MEENTPMDASNEEVQETTIKVKRPYVRKTTAVKKTTTATKTPTVRKPRVAKTPLNADEVGTEIVKPRRGRPAKVATPVEAADIAPAESEAVVVIEEFNDAEAAKQIKRNLNKLKKISLKIKEKEKEKKAKKKKKEKAKKKLKEKKAKKKAADKKKKSKSKKK